MGHTFTPAILIHVLAAVLALGLGALVFLRRKGTFVHRMLGRSWAALMLVTAGSTWWIRSSGSFSWIHILSVITLVVLAVAIWCAATGRIARHRQSMVSLYIGSLIIAGAFALLPERLLGGLLWGAIGLV
ncbi:MAG TPA: DUF2306 domain-containing protein [Burkholderiales bacterium]